MRPKAYNYLTSNNDVNENAQKKCFKNRKLKFKE